MIFRAGIVGCGRIGCGFDDDPRRTQVSTHAGAYAMAPDIQLVALSDVDETKLARYGDKFGVAGRYRNYQEMLAKERLDILSICTWADTHRDILEAGVRAGVRAIYCEKPLADSLEAADAMIDACVRSGVTLLVNHKRRFDPSHRQVAAFLRANGLGRIQQVTCYYTSGVSNTGTHLFDLLRLYFGEIVRVQGVFSPNRAPTDQDPNIDGWLRFESGFSAVIQACDVRDYYVLEVQILGARGRLRIFSGTQEGIVYEAAVPSGCASEYAELQPAALPFSVEGSHGFMLEGVRHLVDCLKSGAVSLCSGTDGRKALEVICALQISAQRDGCSVMLPLQECPIPLVSR